MKKGRCLCGKIQYELLENPKYIGYCHCTICQKTHGAPFSAFAAFPGAAFNFIEGQDSLSYYQSSKNVRRSFCASCGSRISFEHKLESTIWISATSLDFDPGVKPKSHMFTDSKAPWHDITDNLQHHPVFPHYS